jgi:hypothetical protein
VSARSLCVWIGAAFAAAVAVAGCAAVPTLTFEASDAGWDTCPDAAPPGTICCGPVPCSGTGNCLAECPACSTECDAASLCCAHGNNVVCRAPGSSCN